MGDPTKNIKKGALIGLVVGFFLAALANGWMIIEAIPDTGQDLAKGYVWILPAVGGILLLLHLFNKIHLGTVMRGFFMGFCGITVTINVIILGMLDPLINWALTLNWQL